MFKIASSYTCYCCAKILLQAYVYNEYNELACIENNLTTLPGCLPTILIDVENDIVTNVAKYLFEIFQMSSVPNSLNYQRYKM